MNKNSTTTRISGFRNRLFEIIFEADTPAGKLFDVVLLVFVALSTLLVILESVAEFRDEYFRLFRIAEWTITGVFTIEYIFRFYCVRRRLLYAFSFFGLIDFLAVVPSYIGLLLPGSHYLLVVRTVRLLRVFRVLKLAQYLREAAILQRAVLASMRKIVVFLMTVVTAVIIIGSLMYVIEGGRYGFTSIPTGIYWAIVTLTTVGYGDISPQTPAGKLLASAVMLLGYGIIAVPTGIVTTELARATLSEVSTQSCPSCGRDGHDKDAEHCKFCGASL